MAPTRSAVKATTEESLELDVSDTTVTRDINTPSKSETVIQTVVLIITV